MGGQQVLRLLILRRYVSYGRYQVNQWIESCFKHDRFWGTVWMVVFTAVRVSIPYATCLLFFVLYDWNRYGNQCLLPENRSTLLDYQDVWWPINLGKFVLLNDLGPTDCSLTHHIVDRLYKITVLLLFWCVGIGRTFWHYPQLSNHADRYHHHRQQTSTRAVLLSRAQVHHQQRRLLELQLTTQLYSACECLSPQVCHIIFEYDLLYDRMPKL